MGSIEHILIRVFGTSSRFCQKKPAEQKDPKEEGNIVKEVVKEVKDAVKEVAKEVKDGAKEGAKEGQKDVGKESKPAEEAPFMLCELNWLAPTASHRHHLHEHLARLLPFFVQAPKEGEEAGPQWPIIDEESGSILTSKSRLIFRIDRQGNSGWLKCFQIRRNHLPMTDQPLEMPTHCLQRRGGVCLEYIFGRSNEETELSLDNLSTGTEASRTSFQRTDCGQHSDSEK